MKYLKSIAGLGPSLIVAGYVYYSVTIGTCGFKWSSTRELP